MGIGDKVVQNQVRAIQDTFIGETDRVQFAVLGYGLHPILHVAGLLGMVIGKPRYLVVTDNAAYLLAYKKSTNLTAEDVLGTYPRDLDLSGFSGLYPKLRFDDGGVVYIPKPYDKPLRELFAAAS